MSQSAGSGSGTRTNSQPLGTTSARLIAVHIKSANKNIFRALVSLASANLIMRLAGMLGLLVTNYKFGASSAMDAYNIAAAIPTTLSQLFASALESSVIPVYARVRTRGKEHASKLFSTLLNILIILMVLFAIVMLIFRQQLVLYQAPGLTSKDLAFSLTPFIFPVIVLMTLNSFMECLLNTEGKFGWPAYAGIAVPLTLATVVLIWGSTYGVLMMCIGTMLGQLIQLTLVIVRAHKANIVYRPFMDLKDANVRKIAQLAWPSLFDSLIQQLAPIADNFFASFQEAGSITAIAYVNKLTSVPVGVIFASVGKAALPYMASQAAINDMKAFKGTLRLYTWLVGGVTLVLAIGMIALSEPIVFILFQHGAFTPQMTVFVSKILIGNLIGLPPMAVGFLLARAFSALKKPQLLIWTTVFTIVANAIFDYTFGLLWGTFGITLATSVIYYCTMIMLIMMLRATIGPLDLFTPPEELPGLLAKIGLGRFNWQGNAMRDTSMLPLGISYATWRLIIRGALIAFVFAVAIIGAAKDPTITLAVSFGAIILLWLLRYPYALLICWALFAALVGSDLPLFNGAHLLSGLTIPTLLLLFYLPTKEAFKRMIALPIFLIFFFLFLPTMSMSPLTISEFFTEWTTSLDYIAVAVLVILLINTRKRMHALIDTITIIGVFASIYGIYSYFTKLNGVVDTSTGYFRTSSFFGQTPPTFGMFLSIVIPLAVYRTLTLKGKWRALYIAITILYMVSLGLTFDRGPLIAVPVSLILMIMLIPSDRLRFGTLGASLGAVALLAVVGSLFDIPLLSDAFRRFSNSDVTNLNGRTDLWQAILSHFNPTYLLGYGLHASDQLLVSLRIGFGGAVIDTATHNIFLEILYDHGIIGLVFLLLTLIALALGMLSLIRKATYEHRLIIATSLAVFISVVIQCFESNDIWNQEVGIYFMIAMALPFVFYWSAPKQADLTVISKESYERETGKMAAIKLNEEQKRTVQV
jgi:murein biosynthesis integral membrane protein MurJ